MKLMLSTWTIVIGALCVPKIEASRFKEDQASRKLEYGSDLTQGGIFMRTKMLRNERALAGQSRIVGGKDADIGEYPFFVEWGGCGASLVHNDIIVSAAHCAAITSDTVYVGSSRQLAHDNAGGRGLPRTITERVPHPSYTSDEVDFDYLVMKLDSPVLEIQPVRLNEDPNIPTDADVLTVIGYGTTTEGGDTTTTLQEVDVSYIPTAGCNLNYDGEIKEDTMLCAGTGGGKDSCQGDSGGPLIIQDGDTFTQVGIVSWGEGCARPDSPGVYSRVSGQIDWIKAQICRLSDDPPDYCNAGSKGPAAATGGPISSPPTSGNTGAPVLPPSIAPPTVPTSATAPTGPPTVPTSLSTTAPFAPPTAPISSSTAAPVLPLTAPPSPVTAAPVPSPTSSSDEECADSSDMFPINDLLEKKDCTWLGDNQATFGYLCRLLDVASICKRTCNACQYFYP